jgi:type IV pilus assembly protein PilW
MKYAASSARMSGGRQNGFSVIELMVAMVISLLLLGGVVTIFISSKGTYERVERLSRTQESGRFALDAIVRDIRSAGYMGCSRPSTWANTLTGATTTLAWNFAEAITGYEFSGGTWSPGVPAGLTSLATTAANGSDVLVLRVPTPAASSATLRLTDKMSAANSTMSIATVPTGATAPLNVGDVVMLADCHARAVFQISAYTGSSGVIDHATGGTNTPGNASADLGHAFEANSQIVPVRTVAYYIGQPVGGQPGLWRVAGNGAAEELVQGVERMELLFGVDANSDRIADDYVTADLVGGANWGNVISVSVSLLVRSPDQYGTERDANTYTLLDKTFTAPSDRYVRQVFISTATLRNRAL